MRFDQEIAIKPGISGDIAGGDTIAYHAQLLLETCVDVQGKGGIMTRLGESLFEFFTLTVIVEVAPRSHFNTANIDN